MSDPLALMLVLIGLAIFASGLRREEKPAPAPEPSDATAGRHCTLLAHEINALVDEGRVGKRGNQATFDLYERELAPKVYRVVQQLRQGGHVTDGSDLNFPKNVADLEQVSRKLRALGLRIRGPVQRQPTSTPPRAPSEQAVKSSLIQELIDLEHRGRQLKRPYLDYDGGDVEGWKGDVVRVFRTHGRNDLVERFEASRTPAQWLTSNPTRELKLRLDLLGEIIADLQTAAERRQ